MATAEPLGAVQATGTTKPARHCGHKATSPQAHDQARAQACWNDLLRNSSYASLKIFNIIDWIGEGSAPYTEAMKACTFSHGGYVARMQEYMGVKPNVGKKPRKKKK